MQKTKVLNYFLAEKEVLEFFDIKSENLAQWLKDGAPKAKNKKYDLKSLVAWRLKTNDETKKKRKSDFVYGTNDTASFFDVDADTVQNWAKKGAPKEARGKWNLKALVEWRYKTDNLRGKESPEVRKLKAEADLKEIKKEQEAIKLAVTEGRYIPVDQVTRDLTRLFNSIKTSLLSIGHKVAVEINSIDEEAAAAANSVIDKVIRDALEQLAKSGIYGRKK